MVNATRFTVLNKNGATLLAPTNMSSLWSSGNCAASSDGDPIVVYDNLADRWLLAQFSTGNEVCVAVSQTNDATGAYYTYEFSTPDFPDYFKIGVWGDAYYMSANENSYTAYAFDRAKMLVGQAATSIRFSGQDNLLMPARFTGNTAPPAGTPGYFYTFKDDAFHGGGADRLEVFEFRPNWAAPASSTFVLTNTIPVDNFAYTVCGYFVLSCIPQGGTTRKVDPVSEWPMWQLQYRNLGTHQALVSNFAVDVGSDRAGICWFELRRTTGAWTLYQQGTYAPEADKHYWMGSMGMDKQGNIALGYSVSNASMNPALRYTMREATDPLGSLQTEAVLVNGTGSQTSSNRWGDYSALTVDPADDCTFWFTSEYYVTSSGNGWVTRIGKFVMPSCLNPPNPAISLRNTVGTDPTVCATSTSLTVTLGTAVTYCYEVTNTGNVTFTTHTLTSTLQGVVLNSFPYALVPGASAFITQSATLTQTTFDHAVWTATNGPLTATAPASATVTVAWYRLFLPLLQC